MGRATRHIGTVIRHAVGALAALVLVAALAWLVASDRAQVNGEPPATRATTARATTQAAIPPGAPGRQPASGPTTRTQPAVKWTPPRFRTRQDERQRMADAISGYRLTDKAVLAAMGHVPRHEFVPDRYQRSAYDDSPLPIGHGQTISQPYMVAEMTRLLKLTPETRVLEVGTGSGYQAAVLTEFTPHVHTIEIIKPLADAAAARLRRLGYGVVKVRHGDGYFGWTKDAPASGFGAIIVTAAAGQIPPPLIRQLAPGGRMVIPVGPAFSTQWLMLVTKDRQGKVRTRSLMAVRFVPLTRKDGSAP